MTSTTITAADALARIDRDHDRVRAERELAAIAERTAVDQRLEADDVSERALERVLADVERVEDRRVDVPAAPIILVTTGHPTLHQHPGPAGEDVHPRLGRLLQPRHLSSVELTAAAGIPWAADNDCFQGLDETRFVKMIDRLAGLPGCLFVTVPDVVGDAAKTLEMFEAWAPELERRGLPLGYVAQDGATFESTPWDRIAALFIGGSDEFKLGPAGARLAREAKRRGKWVHWGRVNTRKRFDLIVATGAADSFDGSKWARWRKTYLPGGLLWLEEAEAMRAAALEVDRRGLRRVAGGSPELDDLRAEVKALEAEVRDEERAPRVRGDQRGAYLLRDKLARKRAELERARELLGVREVGEACAHELAGETCGSREVTRIGYCPRCGAYRGRYDEELAGDPASETTLYNEAFVDKAAAAKHRGDVRVAELWRRAAGGDTVALKAARAYPTDADLERAEATSSAQDFTDGGGWVDENGAAIDR